MITLIGLPFVPIGPVCSTRMQMVERSTLQVHIVMEDVIIDHFTSPAARMPYPIMNAPIQTMGFTMLIQHIM